MKKLYITDFDGFQVDKELYDYHKDYFERYYNESFEPNKGTETILELLSNEGGGNNWLDLGAGSTTLFWSIPMKPINNVECNDITIEALKVLNDFVVSDDVPKCYEDVLKFFEKTEEQLSRKINYYHVFNVFEEWPKQIKKKYDLITEFGTFGQARSEKEFIDSFVFAEKHLIKRGKLIGANWIRKKGSQWKYGIDNDFVSIGLIKKASRKSEMKLEFIKECPIINDKFYNSVIVFMLKK